MFPVVALGGSGQSDEQTAPSLTGHSCCSMTFYTGNLRQCGILKMQADTSGQHLMENGCLKMGIFANETQSCKKSRMRVAALSLLEVLFPSGGHSIFVTFERDSNVCTNDSRELLLGGVGVGVVGQTTKFDRTVVLSLGLKRKPFLVKAAAIVGTFRLSNV